MCGQPTVLVRRIQAGPVHWEMATLEVPPALKPWVQGVTGFEEWGPAGNVQLQTPQLGLTMVLDFDEPLVVRDAGGGEARMHPEGFIAGLYDRHVETLSSGRERGIQIDLTLAGARRLLGLPLCELKNTSVALTDVAPRPLRSLTAQLRDLPGWHARLRALCEVLQATFAEGARVHPAVAHALSRLRRCSGRVRLAQLAKETGYSPKHLTALFHIDAGLPPATVGRIARFDALTTALRAGSPLPWAQLADRFAFADQAHLAREVRRFSGRTPRELHQHLTAFSKDDPAGHTP